MNKRITNKEIMEAIMNLNNTLASLDARVTKLESGSSSAKKSASTKSAPKTSNKKSSGKSAPKSSKVINLADFEPKKDADGNYNWASYKACRRHYVEKVSGKKLSGKNGEWLENKVFNEFAEPFDEAYKYVKKSDR